MRGTLLLLWVRRAGHLRHAVARAEVGSCQGYSARWGGAERRTLLVGDGRRGAADPVFAACDPILLWAEAVYTDWQDREDLDAAFAWGREKLLRARSSIWYRVCGPATAFIASAWRIGWRPTSFDRIASDDGRVWSLSIDPPAALAAAIKSAAKRWRLARLMKFAGVCAADFLTSPTTTPSAAFMRDVMRLRSCCLAAPPPPPPPPPPLPSDPSGASAGPASFRAWPKAGLQRENWLR